MPGLNLLMFLSIAMAGILTVYIYRLDVDAYEGEREPPTRYAPNCGRRASSKQYPLTLATHVLVFEEREAEFIEVAYVPTYRSDPYEVIKTDFIHGSLPSGACADETSNIRCA
jgi:hypothetical protein